MSPSTDASRLENTHRWVLQLERCFLTPAGAIDLLGIRDQIGEEEFRRYIAHRRWLRQFVRY